MKWFCANEEHVFWQEITNNISYMITEGYDHQIIIGTDSQRIGNEAVVVVALCIVSDMPDYERVFFYSKEKRPKFTDLYSRISYETQKSIEIADLLKERTTATLENLNISIHLDVSSNEAKNKTSKYSSSLISLVKAYDYPHVQVKPNSWAASYIADKFTKNDR